MTINNWAMRKLRDRISPDFSRPPAVPLYFSGARDFLQDSSQVIGQIRGAALAVPFWASFPGRFPELASVDRYVTALSDISVFIFFLFFPRGSGLWDRASCVRRVGLALPLEHHQAA